MPGWNSSGGSPRPGRIGVCAPGRGGLTAPPAASRCSSPGPDGLDGIERHGRLELLYWLSLSRRDLVHQSPADDGTTRGTFALRSPVRPNPIGTSVVTLVAREGATLLVRGLDCLDGTPLLDIKPDRADFVPLAPRQPGDDEVGP